MDIRKIRLSIPVGKNGADVRIDRREIWASDGVGNLRWRVDSIRSLFRGDRLPPPECDLARYPPGYMMFFHGIESSVLLFCSLISPPTDAEFIDLYSQLRRHPDGKSLGRLHDVMWQGAALALGLRPWSEAEYTAVFSQLARSARHFKTGASSRNYLAYLRQTLGKAQSGLAL